MTRNSIIFNTDIFGWFLLKPFFFLSFSLLHVQRLWEKVHRNIGDLKLKNIRIQELVKYLWLTEGLFNILFHLSCKLFTMATIYCQSNSVLLRQCTTSTACRTTVNATIYFNKSRRQPLEFFQEHLNGSLLVGCLHNLCNSNI